MSECMFCSPEEFCEAEHNCRFAKGMLKSCTATEKDLKTLCERCERNFVKVDKVYGELEFCEDCINEMDEEEKEFERENKLKA